MVTWASWTRGPATKRRGALRGGQAGVAAMILSKLLKSGIWMESMLLARTGRRRNRGGGASVHMCTNHVIS
ncbi:hypothetical protein NTCA1_32530 [Novosphingobium sp. TCA1]|nr:hypothetical protein NTCA1_32530 [Novosphingobium sp. TCA1]